MAEREWIPDEQLKEMFMRVNGRVYFCDLKDRDFKEGELVFDRGDNSAGHIDFILDGRAAVRDEGGTAELNIDVIRLVKLKPLLSDMLEKFNKHSGVFD